MVADLPSPKPLLILVDGHSLAFRSYFAFAKGRDGGLRTSTGIPTSVTYGFLKALLEVLEAQQPQYLAIAFDLAEKSYRHEVDETYKANRPETPEDFIPDLINLQELLAALSLPVITAPGYEADDIIGTLSRRANHEGLQVKILSGDRDLFQLVDPDENTKILYLSTTYGKGAPPPKEFGVQQVRDKLGVLPSQVVDFKALCGDKSDNIPGVPGIGEKTAVQLLSTYGSLDQVYASLDELKGAVKRKLEDGQEAARHSQYMAQIHLDVPLDLALVDCKLEEFQEEAVLPLLEKLEFRTFQARLHRLQQRLRGEPVEVAIKPSISRSESSVDEDVWFFSADDTATAQATTVKTIAPQIIDTPEKLDALVALLQTRLDPEVPTAWDTETTDLEPRDAKLVGIGCCWGTGPTEVAYIPIGHTHGTQLERTQVLTALRPILESAQYPKALQNAKFDRLVLRQQGIELAGVGCDTMLASYVLNPDDTHKLSALGLKYLGLMAQEFTDLVPKGQSIAEVAIPAVADYCGMDAYSVFCLVPILRAKLAEASPDLLALLNQIEQPLEPVLADMEWQGILIDQPYLQGLSKQLEQSLLNIEQHAYDAAGSTFNLGSPKQLSELLFETLGLDRKKSRKTKTGGYSTDAATLEKLQGDHPVVDAIVEYRTLAKLKSTYVDALPSLVRSDTGRIHTDFNQAVTATGRLSSSDPNLQNIPIRTEFSRQIRKAFIPAPGWVMVAADYSQIELRILAHLSQEEVLLEAYQTNQDVHTLTAQLLFDQTEISSDQRRLGKIINFGVIYGMGAQRFAREAGVSRKAAQEFIDRFNTRYAKVFQYLKRMEQEAIAQGYVTTLCGRRRYFNFSSESLKRLRGQPVAEIDLDQLKLRDQYDAQLLRAAANAPIQGSSADIIKIAMVKLHDLLRPHEARLLLQVHDELVFEMPAAEWHQLESMIQTTMESAVPLSVPLKVEIHSGPNWMATK